MFHSTRIKLTAWYLASIMIISILFSLVIYSGINSEFKRFEHLHSLRIEREQENFPLPTFPKRIGNIDPDMILETRNRLTLVLILVNLGIFIVAGGTAYFLSGKTLRPIKEMVDEQNRFITDASHELRTPLTSLRSEIEVNLRNKNLNLNDARKLLKSNLEEVNNLQSLSDSLMELASFQKKNGNFSFEDLSLLEITQIAMKKITPLAVKKHIHIKNKVIDCTLVGNKLSLTELFTILLDNAVKYSNKDSGIFLNSEKKDHTVTVYVKDEGIGIDKEDLPFIFDRFYRADKSRSKEKTSGYGLGLSIAKKIADIHNGSISVKNNPNKGSTFTVDLPIAQPFHLKKPSIFS